MAFVWQPCALTSYRVGYCHIVTVQVNKASGIVATGGQPGNRFAIAMGSQKPLSPRQTGTTGSSAKRSLKIARVIEAYHALGHTRELWLRMLPLGSYWHGASRHQIGITYGIQPEAGCEHFPK